MAIRGAGDNGTGEALVVSYPARAFVPFEQVSWEMIGQPSTFVSSDGLPGEHLEVRFRPDALNEVIDDNVQDRQREAIKAERIIDEAVIQFRQWFESLAVVPTIKALRAKIRTSVQAEVDKTLNQLNHLADEDKKAVERMMNTVVNKLLHDPTSYLKRNGCSGDRSISLDIARKLFKLDE